MARTLALLCAAALAATVAGFRKPTGNTVVICTKKSAGFNMPVDGAAPTPDFSAQSNYTISDGPEGKTWKGFGSDVRQVMFTGMLHGEQKLSNSLKDLGFPDYKLLWLEGTNQVITATRYGYCDIGWMPFTQNTRREACPSHMAQGGDAHTSCRPLESCIDSTKKTPNGNTCEMGFFGYEKFSFEHGCCIDFAHSYFQTGLALLHRTDEEAEGSTFSFIYEPTVVNASCFLLITIIISGHLMWLLERYDNKDQFPTGYLDGIDDSVWWSAVTVTTVGYGDKAPITGLGRLFGFVWMFAGLMICAYFTGAIASEMTAASLQNQIEGLKDFTGKRVCTTKGYLSMLQSEPVTPIRGGSYAECLEKLDSGDVSAVWYDKPILDYEILSRDKAAAWATTKVEKVISLSPAFPQNPRPEMAHLKELYSLVLMQAQDSNVISDIQRPWFESGGSGGSSTSEEYDETMIIITLVCIVAYTIMKVVSECGNAKSRSHWLHKFCSSVVDMEPDREEPKENQLSRDEKLDRILKIVHDLQSRIDKTEGDMEGILAMGTAGAGPKQAFGPGSTNKVHPMESPVSKLSS